MIKSIPTKVNIKDAVCLQYGISLRDLLHPIRDREITEARFAYCYLCRKHIKRITLEKIAAGLYDNHTSVIHACRRAKQLMSSDPQYKLLIETIEKNLGYEV